jgi:hypothetical protein
VITRHHHGTELSIILVGLMDYNINENRLVFVKTNKIGIDWFHRFTEN